MFTIRRRGPKENQLEAIVMSQEFLAGKISYLLDESPDATFLVTRTTENDEAELREAQEHLSDVEC
jgi:hypothetical protein